MPNLYEYGCRTEDGETRTQAQQKSTSATTGRGKITSDSYLPNLRGGESISSGAKSPKKPLQLQQATSHFRP